MEREIGRRTVAKKWTAGLLIGVLVVLAGLPLVLPMGYIKDILFYVFLYILLGQGFNVLAGYTGLVSLGQAAFFGMGALVARMLWVSGLPSYLAIAGGGVASMGVSAIIGLPCLRLRGAYFSMGTLALTIICNVVASNVFITESFLPPAHMAAYSTTLRYYAGLLLALAATVMVYRLANSKLGMGMIAIREDEDAARSVGVYVFRRKLQALLISAFTTGIAGGLFAFYQVALYYYQGFSPLWSFDAILVTFIGGSGTLFGPVLGAVFYVGLKEIFALTLGKGHIVIFGVIFILVVLFFPRGLATVWEKIRLGVGWGERAAGKVKGAGSRKS
jgi:branched-chain amino acid transport system permease protein